MTILLVVLRVVEWGLLAATWWYVRSASKSARELNVAVTAMRSSPYRDPADVDGGLAMSWGPVARERDRYRDALEAIMLLSPQPEAAQRIALRALGGGGGGEGGGTSTLTELSERV